MQDCFRTVLVVDDDKALLWLTCKMVEAHGATIYSAQSGPEALEIFRQHGSEIDFVISDVVMPGMFGDQLMRQLLQMKPNLKFILMSGNPINSLETDVELSEGYNFLQKPFAMQDLTEIIRVQFGIIPA